jgi:competence protein ComEA
MLKSLAIKLAMLAATVGLVLWIGWPSPHDPERGPSPGAINVATGPATVRPSYVGAPAAPLSTEATPRRLNLNRASAEDFQQLPGIGPVLAQRIIEWRRQHGAFKQVDELNAVKGIGTKKLQQIRPLVMVGQDKLKAAAGAPSKAAALSQHRDFP